MASSTIKTTYEFIGQARLSDDQIRHLLKPAHFSDPLAAYRCLERMMTTPEKQAALAEALPHLLSTLAEAADSNQVLVNIERLAANTNNSLMLFHDFAHNPRTIEILILLFSGSQFLTEILLRHPRYFARLTAHHRLTQQTSADHLHQEVQAKIAPLLDDLGKSDPIPLLNALRRFQRWELLRIGASDLLGAFDLPTVTHQLSHLADSLVEAALIVAKHQTDLRPDDFFVIALGKLGGQELNYSSDIDLLFLCRENATAAWPMGQRLINTLDRSTEEGFLYRVDMRLRPWGRSGPLVSTSAAYLAYLGKQAGLWEKQALLKARVIAGNQALGHQFLAQIQPYLFTHTPEAVRAEIHKLKQRIEGQLKKRGQSWGEVKLGAGSIRDIEFVTQYLQLAHGGPEPHLRSGNTLEALSQLSATELLSSEAFRVLTDSYVFLRTVEHHLQLMHYQQTHQLPTDPKALNHLARRLGFAGSQAGENFIARYEQHSAVIRVVYQQYLETASPEAPAPSKSINLLPHLTRLHPAYLTTFSKADIEHHADLADHLNQARPIIVEATPLDESHWRVTVVGYDYLGQLSLICGLLFVYGLNISAGDVFSYGPPAPATKPARPRRPHPPRSGQTQDTRRKIVDVFTVHSVRDHDKAMNWEDYSRDLTELVQQLAQGDQHQAQGSLAKRVAQVLRDTPGSSQALTPVEIEIDNEASERHTVLRIEAPDTIGFLYEFSNALALSHINIRRMTVDSEGNHIRDVLYVTDAQHRKITDPEKQHELRVATVLIKQFTHLLPQAPNPELALLHFREFVGRLFSRPNWTEALTSLEQPQVLNTLARLLGASDFLWDDFLRMQHANLFPILQDVEALALRKSRAELRAELEIKLREVEPGPAQAEMLNAFKDREMFRIDMRQIQGHIVEIGEFSKELTDLAELVVEAAYRLAAQELRAHYGLPRLENKRPCPLTICALGKCGGRELGFASDIELMFIYAGNGRTTGPRVITTAEFFDKLVSLVDRIITAKRKGIFEIDLQLRPYGKAGSLAVSFESFQRYFAPAGEAWPYERQALVRLRPFAGDPKLGEKVIRLRDEMIYTGQAFDVAAMRAMRERQLRHLVTAGTINAKFSPGGLVDVEYLIQGLQLMHGHQHPALRLTNTNEAMQALVAARILPAADYEPLHEALIFLRHLINALRMVRGNAKDLTVPAVDSEAFAFLARRLNYNNVEISHLWEDLIQHTEKVQEINIRLLL